MSYLGKISAIVSANTSDFSAKLAASGKEVQSWARSLNSAVNTASSKAASSLRGIYTEAQKAERALQAIQAKKISFSGFDAQNLGAAVDRMRALISVTKEVNEPLAKAARTLEKLPASMQGGFIDAMKRAQLQAERLAVEVDKIGSGAIVSNTALEKKFEAIAARAMTTAEAVSRLKEAAQAVSGLASGSELRFRNPEFAAEMARAKGIQTQAAGTPGGDFSAIIQRQSAAANDLATAFARMEESRLTAGGNVKAATAEYERQLTVVKAINSELEQSVAVTKMNAQGASGAVVAANRFTLNESDRRKGVLAQRNAASFDAATEGLLRPPPAQKPTDLLARKDDIVKRSAALASDLQGSISGDIAGLENLASAAKTTSGAVGVLKDNLDRVEKVLGSLEEKQALRNAAESFSMSPEDLAKTAKEKGAFQPLGDLEKSAADLRTMQDEMRKLKAESDFGGSVEKAFEASKISKAKAEITTLQGILIKIGVTTGDAADAVDDLAAGWKRATSEVGGTVKYANQLKEAADGAAEAVQQAVNASGQRIDVKGTLAKVGDVGRFGADKASLAFQQLGFAIDDFMSSTGGVDQKIRAVSNNISQMAYIVGSTKGLFIALGVTMASQAAVMAYKWASGGKTAEDQAKALNEALAKQKSLLEDLKQAIDSFASSLGRNMFSKPAAEARDFQKQIEEIAKKQKEGRDATLADLDPTVQKERATQAAKRKQLESETDIGRRVVLQQEIRQSAAREREAAARAASAPPPSKDRAAEVINRAGSALFARMTRGSETVTERDVATLDRARARAGEVGASTSPQEMRDTLQRQLDELISSGLSEGDAAVSESIRELQELISALEAPIKAATDALAISVLEGSVKVAKSLEATQALLDGISFSETRAAADKAAQELTKVVEELKTAEDPSRIAELEKQRSALEQQSSAYRAAAETIRTFADTIKRISTDLADQVAGEAQSYADKARRDANAAAAAKGQNGEFGPNGERRRDGDLERNQKRARARRWDAEAEARRARDEADAVRKENDRARREFESRNDPELNAERKRLEELQATIDSKDATEEQKAAAAEEKQAILKQQQQRWEGSPAGQAAQRRADFADEKAARQQEEFRQQDERYRAGLRGRDLGLTEGERAAREAKDGLLDIGAARDEGMLDAQQTQAQASRFAQEQMRSAAPAIFEMADAVANAVLQGPSRQALEATDVSTVEGSRELNRLLRGDDAAKNVNVVELEKQNQKLTELVTVMKDVAQKMGIVLDL